MSTMKSVQEQIAEHMRSVVAEHESRRLGEIAALKLAGLVTWQELREERRLLRARVLRGVRGGT